MEGATAMMKEASSSVCSRVASETKAPSSRGRGVKRSIHETNNTTMIIPVVTPSKRLRVEGYPSMSSAVAPLGCDDSWKTASVNDIVMTPEDHNVFCSNIAQVDALGTSLVSCFDHDDDECSCSTKAAALAKHPPGEHTRNSAVDLTEDEEPKKWKKDPNADDDEEDDAQQQQCDMAMAREMQKQLDAEGMTATKTGRAWNFVSKVMQMHETLQGASRRERQQQQVGKEQVSTVATDDMVWLVERMLECQEEFLLAGKPVEVDIGYHYTRATNMQNICRDGLLTKAERYERNVHAHSNGSAFGDGVYTGNNPFAFRSFGDVLLLVARMKGSVQSGQEYREAVLKRHQEERAADAPMHNHGILGAIKEDTAVLAADTVEALDGEPRRGMIVLRKSCQCVALVRFDSSIIRKDVDDAPGNSLVHLYHEKLQGILDEFFNGGQKTVVHRVRASEMFATGRGPFAPIIPSRPDILSPRPLPTGFVVSPPGMAQSAPPTLQAVAAALFNNNTPPPGPKPAPPRGNHRSSAAAAAAGAAMSSSRAAEETKKYRERFLIFTRVLLKYLEQKDPPLHVKVKSIIKDCAERNKRQERGYDSVTASMRARLKEVVNETYWKRAEAYLHHFLTQKAKTGESLASMLLGGSAQQGPPVLPSPSHPPTVSPSPSTVAAVASAGYVSTTYPGRYSRASSNVQQADQSTVSYTAPNSLESADPAKAFCAVDDLHSIPKAECSVCLDPLRGDNPVIALSGCGHHFHRACIENVLRHARRCPICRKSICEPVGAMPSGRMTVKRIARSCRGFDDGAGSIEISYTMQGGTQRPYHENPGVPYCGTNRKAYLPDNADGRKLLKRLQYAFSHGLTFTVGTSLSTRRPNSIVWSSIHHKTTLCGGPHGFPDPGYFLNSNEDLDALGVPAADDCG